MQSLLHHYQVQTGGRRRFGLRQRGKSAEFDVIEEEDFIQIDGSYKHVASADVFSVDRPEGSVEGLSHADWARFRFGGFRASEDFETLAVLDCSNDFHLVNFDVGRMQLEKSFKFSAKDFGSPWNVSCFDLFERGSLLVGFDSLSQDFCAFNLRKRKRSAIKRGPNPSARQSRTLPPQSLENALRAGHRDAARVPRHLRPAQGETQTAISSPEAHRLQRHLLDRAAADARHAEPGEFLWLRPERGGKGK